MGGCFFKYYFEQKCSVLWQEIILRTVFKMALLWKNIFLNLEWILFKREMFNCSNCDSLKKAVDTKMTTGWHMSSSLSKSDNCSIFETHLLYVYWKLFLSSFTFRQKINNCSHCNWLTKVLKNVNCSTQFIVKKMVYMHSS